MLDYIRRNISKIILPLSIVIVLCILPLPIKSPYILNLLILSLIRSIAASSWDLCYGYMGVFHFAQITFLGIGAYASALICMHLSVSPFLTMFLGGIIAGVSSLFISLPTLRTRGIFLSLLSFAFTMMVFYIIGNWTDVTRGLLCLYGIPPLFAGVSVLSYYYTAVGLFAISIGVLYAIVKSRYGLSLIAINTSSPSASSLGVEILRTKVVILAITAFLAGMAGGLYAHYHGMLAPSVLDISAMIDMMIMAVFGGLGSLFGPVLGVFVITFSMEFFKIVEEYRFIIYSIMVILIMVYKPRGVYGVITDLVELIKGRISKTTSLGEETVT